ncbi:MAG: M20/M25/M40 family metallo-hydrolase [Eubacteriales bacterium]|nr:M20/M25/M40 family metallo-hydrolase [Eubacteriales bacterium]
MLNKEDILNTFTSLVSIDSPSKGEREMCDYIKSRFDKLGIKYEEDNTGNLIGGNCGNLYAYVDGEKDLEPILFSSHMDTVEPSKNKKAVFGDNGLITSDGTTVLGSDDLAGATAILEALDEIKKNNIPHRPFEILFSVSEETLCDGVKHFDFSHLKSKDAYVFDLDGDIGKAAYCAPTIISFKITVSGKAAHAGFEPEKGVHAVKAAARAVCDIDCGIFDDMSVNIGKISGGGATNIVPDKCEVFGEVRCFNHQKAIDKVDEIKSVFEKRASEIGAKVEFDSRLCVKAFATDTTCQSAKRFENALNRLGKKAEFVSTFGGSDNNYFANNGLNGFVVSTGMNKCHSSEEYTYDYELINAAHLAYELMKSEE